MIKNKLKLTKAHAWHASTFKKYSVHRKLNLAVSIIRENYQYLILQLMILLYMKVFVTFGVKTTQKKIQRSRKLLARFYNGKSKTGN